MAKFSDFIKEPLNKKGKLISRNFFEKFLDLNIDEIITENATTHALSCDIFLAHSSADMNLVNQIIKYLKKRDVKPYIDKEDMELPTQTSDITASSLKSNIEVCNKFILIVTKNSIDSKWTPWELGIATSLKADKDVAILPIESLTVDGDWKNNEYLGLYSQIREREGELIIYDPKNNNSKPLNKWLT